MSSSAKSSVRVVEPILRPLPEAAPILTTNESKAFGISNSPQPKFNDEKQEISLLKLQKV